MLLRMRVDVEKILLDQEEADPNKADNHSKTPLM